MVGARCAEVEVVEKINADNTNPVKPAGRIASSDRTSDGEGRVG